jgi:hypothetical protein
MAQEVQGAGHRCDMQVGDAGWVGCRCKGCKGCEAGCRVQVGGRRKAQDGGVGRRRRCGARREVRGAG